MQNFLSVLWLLVWGGMFTDISNLSRIAGFSDPLSLFQGVRAVFPLAAFYLCLLWILFKRPGLGFFRMPTGFLMGYCAVGAVSSVFLSPFPGQALYWAGQYAAPLLVVWVAVEGRDAMAGIRRILYLNNVIIVVIAYALLPDLLRVGGSDSRFSQFYNLPFGLGEMRANGVGRFALLTIVVAFTYMISRPGKGRKLFWSMVLLPALFMLAQTRSRTSLLGLAISATLIILILGIDWRFILVAPAATYLIYLSGIKWRLQGHVEKLMFLTGREYTWQRGWEQIKHSPFLGWGFHADRLMLNAEHMHNSYLHAGIHSGLIGTLFFVGALVSIWLLILRSGLVARIKSVQGADLPLLMQSVLIVGFMTGRSFFESTAAFYGVDLLILVPAMTYIAMWLRHDPGETEAQAMQAFVPEVSAGAGYAGTKSIGSFK